MNLLLLVYKVGRNACPIDVHLKFTMRTCGLLQVRRINLLALSGTPAFQCTSLIKNMLSLSERDMCLLLNLCDALGNVSPLLSRSHA